MKFLAPILLLILSVGLFFWIVKPQFSSVMQLQQQETQYSAAVDQATAAITQLSNLNAKYMAIDKNSADRLAIFLPDQVSDIDFSNSVADLLSRYGTAPKSLKVGDDAGSGTQPATPAASTGPYGTSNLTFSVSLPYDQFVTLLSGIASSLRFMNVSSIAFSVPAKGQYTYTVGLQTYWLK